MKRNKAAVHPILSSEKISKKLKVKTGLLAVASDVKNTRSNSIVYILSAFRCVFYPPEDPKICILTNVPRNCTTLIKKVLPSLLSFQFLQVQ